MLFFDSKTLVSSSGQWLFSFDNLRRNATMLPPAQIFACH